LQNEAGLPEKQSKHGWSFAVQSWKIVAPTLDACVHAI
jgi:hypothetical protein